MRILHPNLHLQHHRHTGRVLHHKHTSYRGLAVVIALAGAVAAGLSVMAHAAAADLYVYARLPAPIPTEAAVITSPENGSVTTKPRLDVTGTCPIIFPAVIIGILDNGVLSGSTPCTSDGTFALPIGVLPGRHTLIARIYTITDDTGPDSEPIVVFYNPPISGSVSTTDQNNTIPALTVAANRPFVIFGPAKNAVWEGTIEGGTLPYHVHIDWGDGKQDTYTLQATGKQQFEHHYRSMQPHIITMHVTDPAGRSITVTYAAVTPYAPPLTLASPTKPWGGSVLLGTYGAYLLLLVVFGGLWVRSHRSGQFAYAKVPVARHRTNQRRARRR